MISLGGSRIVPDDAREILFLGVVGGRALRL